MLLHVHELQVGYERRAILPPFSLHVERGQVWAVIGPNGAGKSTFLRTLLGLQAPVAGVIERASGPIGYVPQRTEIDVAVPQRVCDLVRMGTERRWSVLRPWAARRHPGVERAMADTDVMSLAKQPWRQLSEGQKQRVLLAQALAGDPALLVLDEPTSAMDLHAEAAIFQLLDRLRVERQLGVIVISHHLALLAAHATHFVLLDKDESLALVLDRAAMLAHPDFVERYGRALHRPRVVQEGTTHA